MTVIEINTINDALDFSQINRVLAIKLQHLGDVLLTTPLFSVLKQQYPHIDIDVLLYKETASILEANPFIHQTYAVDRNWKKKGVLFQLKQELLLLNNLYSNQYDLIVNLTDRWRGGWLTRILKPGFSVSLPYTHRRGKFWRKSFSHIYRVPLHNRHIVEKNLDALRRLGVQPQLQQKKLTFVTSKSSEAKVGQLLKGYQLENKKLIVIHPTSRWMFKAWNPEGFAQVIETLRDFGFFVALISGPAQEEIEYAKAILAKTDSQVVDFSGQLSLNECAALIKRADCYLGLDSVAMHIAAAVDTPCIGIFGPTTDKVWQPWMVPHKVISENFDCRPCGLKGCGDGMLSDCIQAIQPDTVVQAVKSLVNERQ